MLTSVFLFGGFFVFMKIAYAAANHLVISQIQITGGQGKTDNDFVELYNPVDEAVDIGGWQLMKKNIEGTTSSIRQFPSGKIISIHGYFLWANSNSDYASSIGADEKSGASITENNSLALFDKNDNLIDAVAWGSNHQNPFEEKIPFPLNQLANQSLVRLPNNSEGNGQDTDDNSIDFFIVSSSPRSSSFPAVPPLPQSDPEPPPPPSVDPLAPTSTLENYLVKINEIYSNPTTSTEKEWVEIYNSSTSTIDLIGWTLFDGTGVIASPTTTINSSSFYAIEWSGSKLNNDGDIIVLKNPQGGIVDQVCFGVWTNGCAGDKPSAPDKSNTLARVINGVDTYNNKNDFAETTTVTKNASNIITAPAVENSQGANAQNQINNSAPAGSSSVQNNPAAEHIFINEFVSDPNLGEEEWVELYNDSAAAADLTGWFLEEGSEEETRVAGVIAPRGFFLIKSPKGNLNNSGDIISLFEQSGRLVDKVAYGKWNDGNIADNAPVSYDNKSVGRRDYLKPGIEKDLFGVTALPTPVARNIFPSAVSEQNNLLVEILTDGVQNNVILSEFLPNPIGADKDGEYLELQNIGAQEIDLKNWQIGNSAGRKYRFSSSTIMSAKSFLVIKRKISGLSLKNSDEEIKLYNAAGGLVDSAAFEGAALENVSFNSASSTNRASSTVSEWKWSTVLTPGRENIISAPNTAPELLLAYPSVAEIGEEILFDASDSFDTDGDELKFFWDFGDGSKGEGESILYSYYSAKNYNITVRVEDVRGKVISKKVKISIVGQPLLGEDLANISKPRTVNSGKRKSAVLFKAVLGDVQKYSVGELIKTRGVVAVLPGVLSTQMFYLVDEAGVGLPIYSFKKDFPDLRLGDLVEVTGETGAFQGGVRLKTKQKTDMEILATEKEIFAVKLGTAEIDENRLFSLVEVEGEVLEIGRGYFILGDEQGEAKVVLKTGAGFKNNAVKEGDMVNVIGVVGQSRNVYVVQPRGLSDLKILKESAPAEKNKNAGTTEVTEKYLTATAGGITSLFLALLARGRGALAKGFVVGAIAKVAAWKKKNDLS